jgi:Sec-independent protein secretion pathway component TatC
MYGEKEIRALLSVPVIAAIPEIQSAEDLQRERRTMVLGWAMAAVVLFLIAFGSAYSYLRV